MLAALATIDPWTIVSLGATAVWQSVLSHGLSLSLAGIVVAIVVMVFVPGGIGLVRTALGVVAHFLLGTSGGRAILLALACLAIGWETRAYLDSSIELRREMQARIAADQAALATETARVRAAEALAADQRRQAEAQRAVAASAAANEATAHKAADDLQEQVDAYSDQIADEADKASRLRCALSDDDARRLRGIGAAGTGRPR